MSQPPIKVIIIYHHISFPTFLAFGIGAGIVSALVSIMVLH